MTFEYKGGAGTSKMLTGIIFVFAIVGAFYLGTIVKSAPVNYLGNTQESNFAKLPQPAIFTEKGINETHFDNVNRRWFGWTRLEGEGLIGPVYIYDEDIKRLEQIPDEYGSRITFSPDNEQFILYTGDELVLFSINNPTIPQEKYNLKVLNEEAVKDCGTDISTGGRERDVCRPEVFNQYDPINEWGDGYIFTTAGKGHQLYSINLATGEPTLLYTAPIITTSTYGKVSEAVKKVFQVPGDSDFDNFRILVVGHNSPSGLVLLNLETKEAKKVFSLAQ